MLLRFRKYLPERFCLHTLQNVLKLYFFIFALVLLRYGFPCGVGIGTFHLSHLSLSFSSLSFFLLCIYSHLTLGFLKNRT